MLEEGWLSFQPVSAGDVARHLEVVEQHQSHRQGGAGSEQHRSAARPEKPIGAQRRCEERIWRAVANEKS